MYVTPLSPVLEESLRPADQQCLSILQTADATSLKDYINEKIVRLLLRDETCIIAMDDGEDISVPAKILSQYKLAHLCLAWNESDPLTPKQLERFRILRNLQFQGTDGSLDHQELRRRELHRLIEASLDQLSGNTDDGCDIHTILHLYDRSLSEQCRYSGELAIPDIKDEHFVHGLARLEASFEKRFVPLLLYPSIHSFKLNEKNHRREAKDEIERHHNSLFALSQKLETAMFQVKIEIRDQIYSDYRKLSNLVDDLQSLYSVTEVENNIAFFEESLVTIVSEIEELKHLSSDYTNLDQLNWENTPQLIQDLRNRLGSVNEVLNESTTSFFNRLTPFNASEQLKVVIELCQKSLEDISKLPYLKFETNDNYFHLDALMQKIEIAKSLLSSAKILLEDSGYMTFLDEMEELELDPSWILHFMDGSPRSWIDMLTNDHYRRTLESYFHPEMTMLDRRFELYKNITSSISDLALRKIHNRWCTKKHEANYLLERSNRDLSRTLFESDQSCLTIGNIYFNDHRFLQAYFPILCVRKSELSQILANKNCKWDHLIYLNIEELDVEDTLNHNEETKVHIVTSKDFVVDELMEKLPCRLFYSAEEKLPYAKPFELLQQSERYQQARALAGCILSVRDTFHVYQIKNRSIISFLNPSLNEKIFQLIPGRQVNVLYEGVQHTNQLVEAMISPDSEVHVLIENHLLNDKDTGHLEWQLEIIDLLSQAGIRIHNIMTHELFRKYSDTIHSFVKTISLSTEETEDSAIEQQPVVS